MDSCPQATNGQVMIIRLAFANKPIHYRLAKLLPTASAKSGGCETRTPYFGMPLLPGPSLFSLPIGKITKFPKKLGMWHKTLCSSHAQFEAKSAPEDPTSKGM